VHAGRYNLPTVEELGGILVSDKLDADFNPTRDIIIEHLLTANGPRYQRINELHPSYFPLRYPFIFLYGEQDWHIFIPLADVNLQRNPELFAQHQGGFARSASTGT